MSSVRPPTASGDVLAQLRSGRIRGKAARLRAASRLLEGSFYQELFKVMRATVPEGGVLPSSAGQEMFQALMDEHLAEATAMRSEGGLGDALYAYFTRGKPSAEDASEQPRAEDVAGSGGAK
ncbi:MAG: rod-binding protein [Gemmatimonadota bacterium]